jgi:hypothetical protein
MEPPGVLYVQLKECYRASRLVVALALCLTGWSACKDETPTPQAEPERPRLAPGVPDRVRHPLRKRRQIAGEYLIGLRSDQDASVLTTLLPNSQILDRTRLPGSPAVFLLRNVPGHDAEKFQTMALSLQIGCFQPNFEVEIDPEEMVDSIPTSTADDGDSETPSPAAAATDAAAPLLGVIDTGAHISLPGIDAIVWTNPNETVDGNDEDDTGYSDDVRGVDVVSASGTPPLPAGSVDQKGADHGSRVAAIASGTCGRSKLTGTPLKIIPCRGLTVGGYDSEHFLMCLKYFATLAAKGVPLVAVNGSFGTTTEELGSCEVQTLGELRDSKVLFVVAAGQDPLDPPSFPGRLRVANVLPVASVGPSLSTVTSASGKSAAFVAGAVGPQSSVLWPFIKVTDLTCESDIPSTVSFAVPQVTNLAGRLADSSASTATATWFARRNLILTGGISVSALQSQTLSGHVVPFADVVVTTPTDLSSYLSCTSATAAGRIQPIGDTVDLESGQDLVVQGYNLSCAAGAGSIPVYLETKTCTLVPSGPCEYTINLEDTGGPGDEVPGDGLYGTKWTVPASGWSEFTVTLWPDSDADSFDVRVAP